MRRVRQASSGARPASTRPPTSSTYPAEDPPTKRAGSTNSGDGVADHPRTASICSYRRSRAPRHPQRGRGGRESGRGDVGSKSKRKEPTRRGHLTPAVPGRLPPFRHRAMLRGRPGTDAQRTPTRTFPGKFPGPLARGRALPGGACSWQGKGHVTRGGRWASTSASPVLARSDTRGDRPLKGASALPSPSRTWCRVPRSLRPRRRLARDTARGT